MEQFNTKEDVYNQLKTNPVLAKARLKSLYEDRKIWETVKELKPDEDGVVTGLDDKTHRVIESQNQDGEKIYQQQKLVVDSNARIYQLGFNDKEVLTILEE